MIESILTAFAFGTIWFWVLTFLVSIIFIASIDNDHYATPTSTAIVVGLLFWKPIMALSWQAIAISFAVYVLAGILWSLFKWYRFVQKKAAYYHEKCGTTLTSTQLTSFKDSVSVLGNKARLTGWIAWWPWSLIWSVTGDFWNFLYDTMVNAYRKIADREINKFTVETLKPSKREIVTDADRNVYGERTR